MCLYSLPLLPFLLRLRLFSYRGYMLQLLSVEERDSEAGKTITLTLAGFSFSALFILLATHDLASTNKEIYQIIIFYIFISVVGFLTSFSIEAYKFHRWQQHISVILEDMGKLGLIMSVVFLAWVSSIDPLLKHTIILFLFFGWLHDALHRVELWHKYFTSYKEVQDER